MKKKHLFHTVIISFLFKFIAIHKLSNLKCLLLPMLSQRRSIMNNLTPGVLSRIFNDIILCCSRWVFGSLWLTSGFAGFPLGLFLGRPGFFLLESIAKCPRAKVLSPCKITHTNLPRQYRESIACNPHLKTTYAVYQTLSFMIRCQMILSFYLLKVRALIKI